MGVWRYPELKDQWIPPHFFNFKNMGIVTSKICPKCGKTFVAEHNVCPSCNPKTSIAMSALNLVAKLLGGK